MFDGTAERVTPLLERVASNRYAQENLRDGAEKLRAAYRRASKRRVEPTRDEKLREQLRQAALSITEAAKAFKADRKKPKGQGRRRMLFLVGIGAIGAAAALAASDELRSKVFGDETQPRGRDDIGVPTSAPAEKVPA
jgi:hypothetical protein